jgi:hypothetical protein
MAIKRKKSAVGKIGSGKKTQRTGRASRSRRSGSTLRKGKRRGGTLKKRSRGATGLRRKGGPFHSGYDQGYREGHSKGFEDAHQDAYMNNPGAAQPAGQPSQGTTQIAVQAPSEADIASVAGARIGILYICTGKYKLFWENFFQSAEAYFLPGYSKTYYVFTDAESIAAEERDNVKRIYQDNLGWPGNTLLRYAIFRNVVQQLEQECDFVYFFNANMEFVDTVREEILPIHEGIVAVQHPGFYNRPRHELDYEKNPQSLAYIPEGVGTHYYMGGLNGGRTEHYMNLIRVLDESIRADMSNGINAVWYDESHLNKYLTDKNPRVMTPSYGFVEGAELPFPAKILIRDKNNFGGHDYLRS